MKKYTIKEYTIEEYLNLLEIKEEEKFFKSYAK